MKKQIQVILSFAVMLSQCTTIFADYQLYDIAGTTEFSRLNIRKTTVTCVSQISAQSTDIYPNPLKSKAFCRYEASMTETDSRR